MSGGAPRLLRWIARTFPAADRDVVLGDLVEALARRRARGAGTWRWVALQAVSSVRHNAARRVAVRGSGPRSGRMSRGDGAMRTIVQDVRYAVRSMRRSAGFTAILVLTLGLGIGANTLIYSVVDGVILNPFPFPRPSELVGIGPVFPRLNQDLGFVEVLSPAEYVDIAEGSRTLERVVAWDMGNRELADEGVPERVFTAFWWGDAFATLEVEPHLGRGFRPEETERGAAVAIVSHRVWQRQFGADPGIIGRSVGVSGQPYTVVGVMPPGTLLYGTDLWTPMPVGPERYPRGRRQFQVLARMRPSVTMDQVEPDLERIARRVETDHGAEFEEYAGWRLVPATWNDVNVSTLRPAALILMSAVGLVLLIVCVNVASLVLARATSRRREVAVRAALGAGGRRIARQLLTESVVLAAFGALLGVVLAYAGTRVVAAALPTLGLPFPGGVAVNGRVLAFTGLITLGVGILTGISPALGALRADVQTALRSEGTHGATARGRHRMQRVFVAAEVALAMVLLVGGGLLLNSFLRIQRVDAGFETSRLLTMRLTLPPARYPEQADILTFFRELRDGVEALPGVASAGVTTQYPGVMITRMQFRIEGTAPAAEGSLPAAYATVVDDAFFSALGIAPVRGRFLTRNEPAPVAVVNESLAQRYFPGTDPVGRRVNLGGAEVEIVGVAPDVRNQGLERPTSPEMFGPMAVFGGGNQFFLLVRTTGSPRAVLPAVRGVVAELDPEQPIYAVRTMDETFAASLTSRRFVTGALAIFAALALTLAAVGISGVVSYAVSERTREIGVRVALGAGRGAVRWLVVRQALLPVLAGVLVGLGAALGAGRLLASQLFDVRPADPVTLGGVVALFAAVSLLASYLPARRATRLDPLRALRGD